MSDLDPLPGEYARLVAELKEQVRAARVRATWVVNTELLTLYWDIGHAIGQRQESLGWGSRVIDRLAGDLRAEFPRMRGFSRSNLHYMRRIAEQWPRSAFVQQPVGQLPWGHVTVLVDRLDDRAARDWYAAEAVRWGWSRSVLAHQIGTGLATRSGAAPSNFAEHLPAGESDMAQQLVRDPYVFDFLGYRRPTGGAGVGIGTDEAVGAVPARTRSRVRVRRAAVPLRGRRRRLLHRPVVLQLGVSARNQAHTALTDAPAVLDEIDEQVDKLLKHTLELLREDNCTTGGICP